MKKVGKSGAKLEFYAQLNWLHCSSGLLYPPEKSYIFLEIQKMTMSHLTADIMQISHFKLTELAQRQ